VLPLKGTITLEKKTSTSCSRIWLANTMSVVIEPSWEFGSFEVGRSGAELQLSPECLHACLVRCLAHGAAHKAQAAQSILQALTMPAGFE
jgi:hypothetical protein